MTTTTVVLKKHKSVPRLYPKSTVPIAEDAGSVLDDFLQDVSNVPAEVAHLLEEVEAKDRLASESKATILKYDLSIQRHIKANTCRVAHPKQDQYERIIRGEYVKIDRLRTDTVGLMDTMLDNHERLLRRLDTSLAELVAQGIMPDDPDMPSILKEDPDTSNTRPTISVTTTSASNPLHPIPSNVSTLNTRIPNARQPSPNTLATPTLSTSASNARAGARESSAEATKRRRLNAPSLSGLRQSSLGPTGTPKSLTPTGSVPNIGGIRGSSAGPRSSLTKKAGVKKVAPHQRIGHLNPTSALGTNGSTGSGLKKGRRMKKGSGLKDWVEGAGTGDEGEFDDENAAFSRNTIHVQNANNRNPASLRDSGAGAGQRSAFSEGSVGTGGQAGSGEDDGGGDDEQYCTCGGLGSGSMIACDGEGCPYEWLHFKCVGITSPPNGAWLCDECRRLGRPLKPQR